jgi:adenylate cyclase
VCLVFFIGERTVYGWTELTELKADPELAKIPVFVIFMVADENNGYSLGASEYLTKPIDRTQKMLRKILKVLWAECS